MGFDLIELVLGIEAAFDVEFPQSEVEACVRKSPDRDMSMGALMFIVGESLRLKGREVPADAWCRLVGVFVEVLHVDQKAIVPESRIVRDVGAPYFF